MRRQRRTVRTFADWSRLGTVSGIDTKVRKTALLIYVARHSLFRYIDTTGDVQTGALLIIYGGVSSVSSAGDVTPSSLTSSVTASVPTMSVLRDNNTVVNRIVDSYFGLLDSWGQWHVRAQTSALYLKRSQTLTGKVSPQVSAVISLLNF